ncbi:hypothetical protein [Legionella cardiaca]|uniref:Coiled-coil protein n=1 Tax=Legionella cardiaca TaxID=1071983 RepID=A0ABY8AQ08_9GAMM|nr:hypothetical protein [Legionella cardiaca]WED42785.1 hypothetical protein PXX05_12910 [Legionella cardiaca]
MTVFLDIVKPYIVEMIKDIRDKSVSADNSTSNTILGWMSLGRDDELSKAKRDLADKLLIALDKFANEDSDKLTYENLRALLIKCKSDAAQKAKEKNYDEGKFGPRMKRTIDLLDNLFAKFTEVKLLDIPHDDEPLNVFRYYAASYYAQKIHDGHRISGVSKLAQNPKLTTFSALSDSKEKLIIKTLNECESDLTTLDEKHVDIKENKKKRVLEWLDKLERANYELCTMHGSTISIPITFAFFSTINIALPTLHPDSGFLEECIKKAKNEIDPEYTSSLVLV